MADKIFKILAYLFYVAIAVVAVLLLSTKLPMAGGF
jgi:hypothetical protein